KYRLGQYQNSIWVKNFEEMAQKTVTKKMLKWLPISTEMIENLRKEDSVHKFNETTKEITEEINNDMEIVEAETVEKASKEDLLTLLESATVVGLDMKKIASDNGYDIENLSKTELDFLQNIVDEKINEKM
ncbi:MAG: recombinase RecT, partial [Cetobacterium sp.]